MRDFFATVRVLHREIERRLINALGVHAPAFERVGESLLQLHELGEVSVVERVRLAEAASGVELVVPNLARFATLVEAQHQGLYACA